MTPTIYTHLGAAAIAALIASAATWQVQDWRLGGRIRNYQRTRQAFVGGRDADRARVE